MALLKFIKNFKAVRTVHIEGLAVCLQSLSYMIVSLRKENCLPPVMVLSVDKIWALWTNNIERCVVCHMGAWSIAIRWAAHRAVGGRIAVFESAQVLCVVRLVALQDPKGFIHFEPLPLPPCENMQRDQGSSTLIKSFYLQPSYIVLILLTVYKM